MMDEFKDRLRYKIVLGKFRVERIRKVGGVFQFSIDLPGLGHLICEGPEADVREGDLLTLYTEILAKERPNAKPN